VEQGRFRHFDGLRAVAALMVVANHLAATLGAGSVVLLGTVASHLQGGVAVFFVISGFLLYRPFVAARLGQVGARSSGDYALSRILRIVPAYWVALTVLALTVGLPNVFSSDWWRYYGFGQVYDTTTAFSGLKVAWTLAVEMSFYALLPIYAAIAGRALSRKDTGRAARSELAALGGLAALAIAVRTGAEMGSAPRVLDNTIVGTFDWFALGMALAVCSTSLRPERFAHVARRPGLLWAVSAAAFATSIALDQRGAYVATHVLTGVAAVSLVVPAVFTPMREGRIHRLLASRQAVYLGVISYGIYLWHQPLIDGLHRTAGHIGSGAAVAAALVGVPVAIAVAGCSHAIIEQPALGLKRRLISGRPSQDPGVEPVPHPVPARA
jgi:peptidoglycan/LPS O-acetylase OafA/YrhL